jgi:hypothetical protein
MSLRWLACIQSVGFSILTLGATVLVYGCRSLQDIQLGECEKLSFDEFAENFQFDIPELLWYRYSLHWKDRKLIFSGITQKTDNGGVNVAGLSDSGLTVFSARWRDGRFEILKNNVKMPDALLERSILSDLLLLYRRLPAEQDCIRQNIADGSLWLKTKNDWSGRKGCFVLIDNQPAWSGLRKGKIYFKAVVSKRNGNIPAGITIENYKEGYSAEIRYSDESQVEK